MDLVTTAMSILANTRLLTFCGKYSAHLDYRGWKGEGRGQEGGAKRTVVQYSQSEALVPN